MLLATDQKVPRSSRGGCTTLPQGVACVSGMEEKLTRTFFGHFMSESCPPITRPRQSRLLPVAVGAITSAILEER